MAVRENYQCPNGAVDYVNGVAAGYEWQCVELVNRLYLKRGWTTYTWWGNGDQLYDNAPTGLLKQPQGSITHVHPGDVISMANPSSPYGHAAVVNAVIKNADGTHTLQIVNQNTPDVFSYAIKTAGTITLQGWYGWRIIGVIHAPRS